ncbi:MAG: glutaminyl-peptide cyclotransferase, partial [Akkermansiaceae bacterium]|nr:glutaminyl-peptide cyclotransferase [Akkermansiaceae bacterium]
MKKNIILLAVLFTLNSCQKSEPEQLGYQIISSRPHDESAYTQGLQLIGSRLFESTGMYGQSTLRENDATSGKILRKRPLAKTVFGEGLA